MAALLTLFAGSIAAPTQPVLTTTLAEQVVLATQQAEVMEFEVRRPPPPPLPSSSPLPSSPF